MIGPTPWAPPSARFSPDVQHLLAQLSVAERRVALHACDGLSNKELAQLLGKSVSRIKNQLGTIYLKLGVTGRGRLTALMRPLPAIASGLPPTHANVNVHAENFAQLLSTANSLKKVVW